MSKDKKVELNNTSDKYIEAEETLKTQLSRFQEEARKYTNMALKAQGALEILGQLNNEGKSNDSESVN
tara:strand:+ start:67 stop:270 length:204 start_codon:yes stop_codon:yes gene_type:complete